MSSSVCPLSNSYHHLVKVVNGQWLNIAVSILLCCVIVGYCSDIEGSVQLSLLFSSPYASSLKICSKLAT